MGLLSSLLKPWLPASADGSFCQQQFPEMWHKFVDHLVDTAYNKNCTAEANPQPAPLPSFRLPAAKRLVAIGDLHGDLDKAMRAFKLAGLVDDQGAWIGGDTVCVQVGDILDRGDQELKILFILERLQRQAAAAGGALHVLNGNHETMNVGGNFRYATAGADIEMAAWKRWHQLGQRLKESCNSNCSTTAGSSYSTGVAAAAAMTDAASVADTASSSGRSARQFNPLRHAALKPGGPITQRFLAPHPTVLQVGSTLFVHGGVLPGHVEYGLERINQETRQWLMGEGTGGSSSSNWPSSSSNSASAAGAKKVAPPQFLRGADAVVWARDYSVRDEARCDCDMLQQVLASLPGAQRMVVGHTIQAQGINSACGGRVLRVDVGMSRGCGNGEVQVLEITEDGKHILRLREGQEPQVMTAGQHQQHQQPGQLQSQDVSLQQQQPPQLVQVAYQGDMQEQQQVQQQQCSSSAATPQLQQHEQQRQGLLSAAIASWYRQHLGAVDTRSGGSGGSTHSSSIHNSREPTPT